MKACSSLVSHNIYFSITTKYKIQEKYMSFWIRSCSQLNPQGTVQNLISTKNITQILFKLNLDRSSELYAIY